MTFAAFFSVLTGVFKFFDQVKWLVETLKSTPEEQHLELMIRLKKESENEATTGRPTWE